MAARFLDIDRQTDWVADAEIHEVDAFVRTHSAETFSLVRIANTLRGLANLGGDSQ